MTPWQKAAVAAIGVMEIPGAKTEPKILQWWRAIKAPFVDDETPWCAAFVGGILESCGIRSSRSAAARSYVPWGQYLAAPAEGCIVVFWRGNKNGTLGHVGFVVGRDQLGNLMVCGGNQGNVVSIKPFASDRVLAYRWPTGIALPYKPSLASLPLIRSDGKVSTNEK